MEENLAVPFEVSDSQIPFDLFVSKKSNGFGTQGFLRFTDSAGNLAYRVQKSARKSTDRHRPNCVKLLLDSSENTLVSIHRVSKESWQGFRGNSKEPKDLIFKADRTLDQFMRTEFKILVLGENNEDLKAELMMKGCPFKRACTIYKRDSIVAESSLMYKLGIGKMFVPRNRFRVTMFPGLADHCVVVSLIVIFFDGVRLWI